MALQVEGCANAEEGYLGRKEGRKEGEMGVKLTPEDREGVIEREGGWRMIIREYKDSKDSRKTIANRGKKGNQKGRTSRSCIPRSMYFGV